MALLPVDMTSGTWRAVERYVAERRAELAAECIEINTSAERRAELAARAAELDELAKAPELTRMQTEAKLMADQVPKGMY